MFKKISLVTSIALLTGCATMFNSTSQNVNIAAINDKNASKTRCNLRNEEGSWQAAPNSSVSIHRDGNDMEIQCDNEKQSGSTHVSPSFNGGYLVLDLILDACIISCVVDGVSNSFYEYPQFVSVSMTDKSGAIFDEPKALMTAPPVVENNININNNSMPAKVIQDVAEYYKDKNQRCFVKTKSGKKKFVDDSYCQ